MTTPPHGTITQLLNRAGRGDEAAREELYRLAYAEILKLARARLAREPKLRRREPESLVHEAYGRLEGLAKDDWACRRQFYGYARDAMWFVCIDWIRAQRRKPAAASFEDWMAYLGHRDADEMLALEEALQELETMDARKARVVRMRYIERRTEQDIADLLGVSKGTVQNDWAFARTWLHRQMTRGEAPLDR